MSDLTDSIMPVNTDQAELSKKKSSGLAKFGPVIVVSGLVFAGLLAGMIYFMIENKNLKTERDGLKSSVQQLGSDIKQFSTVADIPNDSINPNFDNINDYTKNVKAVLSGVKEKYTNLKSDSKKQADQQERTISDLRSRNDQLDRKALELLNQNQDLANQVTSKSSELDKSKSDVKAKEGQITDLNNQLSTKSKDYDAVKVQKDKLEKDVADKDEIIRDVNTQLSKYLQDLSERDANISNLTSQLANKTKELDDAKQAIEKAEADILTVERDMKKLQQDYDTVKSKVSIA